MLNYKAKLVFFFSGVLSLGLQAQELKSLDGKDLSNCVVYARDAISASGAFFCLNDTFSEFLFKMLANPSSIAQTHRPL